MIRTGLMGVLVGAVVAFGGVARGGEDGPGPAEKIRLGRDLRAFPEGDYEIVQTVDNRTHKSVGGQTVQTTGTRYTFTFDMKLKPPAKELGAEGEITLVVRRVQVEMEVGAKLIYDSASSPDLKVDSKPAPAGEGAEEIDARKREADLAMKTGRPLAKQFGYLVGRSARAAVRVSLLPNRSQIESFEGLDAAWDQFAAENPEALKAAAAKSEEGESLGARMLKRNYGDAMLNRMMAQGVEFLPPAPPRDPEAPPGTVRKAAVQVGEAWKVTRELVGLRLQPVTVDYACKLASVKEPDAAVTVAWTFEQKEGEGGGEKVANAGSLAETGSTELTFHALSGMLVEMKSTVTRVETVQGGLTAESATRAVETKSFFLRPKEQ